MKKAARDSESLKPLSPERFGEDVAAALAVVADPRLCGPMRAYMKNQFDYLGVKTPVRRAAVRALVVRQKNSKGADLLRCARALWAMHQREYQYVAIDLLAHHVDRLAPAHLPELFRLVEKKSWWDTVDALAHVIGQVVKNACAQDPSEQAAMDKAMGSPNLWVRRVVILHQLGWRGQTDSKRLFGYAEFCAEEKDFFIRKAIGWALRDYARHSPAEVRQFLSANRTRLSRLTIREAGKHLID